MTAVDLPAVPRVLIAEADPWSRDLLKQVLLNVRCDARLDLCADGQEAMDLLSAKPYDLIDSPSPVRQARVSTPIKALHVVPARHPWRWAGSIFAALMAKLPLPQIPIAPIFSRSAKGPVPR